MTNEENNDDFKATANATGDGSSTVTPSPLASMRQYCLTCCNGSAHEVSLCPATSCSLWVYRFGRKPTAAMLAGADDCLMYPVEDGTTIAEFFEGGGTVLRAIRRHCIDCSGDLQVGRAGLPGDVLRHAPLQERDESRIALWAPSSARSRRRA